LAALPNADRTLRPDDLDLGIALPLVMDDKSGSFGKLLAIDEFLTA
jgi:hypothetical protein